MKLRSVLVAVVAGLLMSSVALAQGQGRVSRGEVSFPVEGVLGSCGDFDVAAEWTVFLKWTLRVDKDGLPVQELDAIDVADFIVYNSTDPEKWVSANSGMRQMNRLDYAVGDYRFTLNAMITVPHYGRIWSETGLQVLECDPYTFENCTEVRNTGHAQWGQGDVEALCDYLR